SVAVTSGLARTCGEASGVPSGLKRIVAGPFEVKDSGLRWSKKADAATAMALADAAGGVIVGLLVANGMVARPRSFGPKFTYFSLVGWAGGVWRMTSWNVPVPCTARNSNGVWVAMLSAVELVMTLPLETAKMSILECTPLAV